MIKQTKIQAIPIWLLIFTLAIPPTSAHALRHAVRPEPVEGQTLCNMNAERAGLEEELTRALTGSAGLEEKKRIARRDLLAWGIGVASGVPATLAALAVREALWRGHSTLPMVRLPIPLPKASVGEKDLRVNLPEVLAGRVAVPYLLIGDRYQPQPSLKTVPSDGVVTFRIQSEDPEELYVNWWKARGIRIVVFEDPKEARKGKEAIIVVAIGKPTIFGRASAAIIRGKLPSLSVEPEVTIQPPAGLEEVPRLASALRGFFANQRLTSAPVPQETLTVVDLTAPTGVLLAPELPPGVIGIVRREDYPTILQVVSAERALPRQNEHLFFLEDYPDFVEAVWSVVSRSGSDLEGLRLITGRSGEELGGLIQRLSGQGLEIHLVRVKTAQDILKLLWVNDQSRSGLEELLQRSQANWVALADYL